MTDDTPAAKWRNTGQQTPARQIQRELTGGILEICESLAGDAGFLGAGAVTRGLIRRVFGVVMSFSSSGSSAWDADTASLGFARYRS
jgi:hypothetical protein